MLSCILYLLVLDRDVKNHGNSRNQATWYHDTMVLCLGNMSTVYNIQNIYNIYATSDSCIKLVSSRHQKWCLIPRYHDTVVSFTILQ